MRHWWSCRSSDLVMFERQGRGKVQGIKVCLKVNGCVFLKNILIVGLANDFTGDTVLCDLPIEIFLTQTGILTGFYGWNNGH